MESPSGHRGEGQDGPSNGQPPAAGLDGCSALENCWAGGPALGIYRKSTMRIEPKLPLGRKNAPQKRVKRGRRCSEHFLIPGAEVPNSVGTVPILGQPRWKLPAKALQRGEILSP